MKQRIHLLMRLLSLLLLMLLAGPVRAESALIDAHIHYSHDAWERFDPERAIAVLREARLKRAFVSSSSDEGTQKLYRLAPELVVPVLRPYRQRGETHSWMHDDSVVAMLARLLQTNRYAGIGEFHASAVDYDLPVLRQVIALAREHGIFLHAHTGGDGIDRIFQIDPDARVLWAHAGFEDAEVVGEKLRRYPNLWADLAFREEIASAGIVDTPWRGLFESFPRRFLVGTDTYTPARWTHVVDHAAFARAWLGTLPAEVAENIAYRNAEALLESVGWR